MAEPVKPDTAILRYSQLMDSEGDPDVDFNELEVEVCDAGAGHYLVIRTQRWAMDDPEELVRLLRHALALCEGEREVGG